MTDDPIGTRLQEVATGDRAAFSALYRLTSAKLFALSMGILKRTDWAEEALQEAYTRIWRSAHRFDPAKGSGISWIATIARNTALSKLMRRPKDEFAGKNEAEMLQLPSRNPTPMEAAMRSSDARQLLACLEELDGEQRRSIFLIYYEGLTQREVADHLDRPIGTVKSWVRRGLVRLRGCLDREDA
jgi:RNA polymerase sigma-70 factor (ECF subfamily)